MALIYVGAETEGLDRIAGYFFNGNLVQYAMIVDRKATVFSTQGKALYVEEGVRLPDGFVSKSIQGFRSRQTGKLVVGIGGFFAGGSKQCGCIIATDYVLGE